MAFNLQDTRTMLAAIERTTVPTTTLVDTFFPNVQTFTTEAVDVEFREGGRSMAPFVVSGSKGVNMERSGSVMRTYKAPLMRPKRVISVSDVDQRGFGEDIYSKLTPEERALEMRARDMRELLDACTRRQEWMAANLLINGEYTINGYADDGKTTKNDTISFGFTNKITLSGAETWDNVSTADPYNDLGDASRDIRQKAGKIPTVAFCSYDVAKYLIENEKLNKYLMIPSRDNMALMSLQPKLVRPDIMRVGYIQALNLEIYVYDAGYNDESNVFKTYIPEGHIIMGVPGQGRRLFGAVTQLENDGQMHTYASEYVPKLTADIESDTTSLAISSRCVLCPTFVDEWATIKVK